MIDPVDALMRTTSYLVPTTKSHTSHVPLPTVVPGTRHYQEAGKAGERILWIVFVLMFLSTLIFSILAYRQPVQKRLFHIITAFITAFATISYFAMANKDGVSLNLMSVKNNSSHHEVYREIYWARYVDWSVTTPLLLLDLAFLAGLNGANMIVAIVADILMVLNGLFAAYAINQGQKWGYYAFGCLAYLVVVYQLAVAGRRNAQARDAKTSKFFNSIAGFTIIIWTVYPIVWGIADGSRKVSVDSEIIIYAILDFLAKPVFGFWLLFTHQRLESTNVHLDGAWSHGFGKREGILRVGDDDEGA